jgi:hypothetical protein
MGEKSMPLCARLGPEELSLLRAMAEEFDTSRSNLARRLLVQALIELRHKRWA